LSATTSAASVPNHARRSRPGPEPTSLKLLEVAGIVPVVTFVVWQLAMNWDEFTLLIPELLPWLAVVIVADLGPVPLWGTAELMMSFPVLLASAFVFPPHIAAFISLVGTVDTREFRRDIPLGRALFNRSNVALSVMAASWVFHEMRGSVFVWPGVLPITLTALLADVAINVFLVILGTRLLTGLSAPALIRNVYGGFEPLTFAGGYISFGLLAIVLATLYSAAGAWGLVAFAIPLLLARQMFVHWRRLADAHVRLNTERKALTQVSRRIADERKDERLAVAAGIHDEVLPPLYKVHLMGQVLRQDLASGRLLDLDADVPDLLLATDAASRALRELINTLRRSTLGAGGLAKTLELLGRDLSAESGIAIRVAAHPVSGSPVVHLLLYQVAREALANAVRHSGATNIDVVLEASDDGISLIVKDDGRGFQPMLVDKASHFGLELMRERIELAGGKYFIETLPDAGTRIIVKVPVGHDPDGWPDETPAGGSDLPPDRP
jgi:signal transduction histidine kinase